MKEPIAGRTFRDHKILIKYDRYRDCVFERCEFVCDGEWLEDSIFVGGNVFVDCKISFEGAGAATVAFLMMIAESGDLGDQVEIWFRELLRHRRPGSSPDLD